MKKFPLDCPADCKYNRNNETCEKDGRVTCSKLGVRSTSDRARYFTMLCPLDKTKSQKFVEFVQWHEDAIIILIVVSAMIAGFFIARAIWESTLPDFWKIVLL